MAERKITQTFSIEISIPWNDEESGGEREAVARHDFAQTAELLKDLLQVLSFRCPGMRWSSGGEEIS